MKRVLTWPVLGCRLGPVDLKADERTSNRNGSESYHRIEFGGHATGKVDQRGPSVDGL